MHEIAWTTAAGPTPPAPPAEQQLLGEHLAHCQVHSRRWFALQCGGEALQAFLAARLVTTLLAAVLLLAAGLGLIG